MDAVIFDGWLPGALPATNLLLIGPPPSGLGEPALGIAAGKDLRDSVNSPKKVAKGRK